MIVETSALVALLRNEETLESIRAALLAPGEKRLSAASYVELCTVMGRDPRGRALIDETLNFYGIQVAPFDEEQARIAAQAYRYFGRGSGHPAGLNLGDVYGYALARTRNEPLLFVGDDFAHTDIVPALPY